MDADLLQKKLKRERRIKLIAVILILIMGIILLFAVNDLLVSCILAFVINYLLNPPINYLERRGLSRSTSLIVVFLVIGTLTAFSIALLYPILTSQVLSLKSQLPTYIQGITKLGNETQVSINKMLRSIYIIDFSEHVEPYLLNFASSFFQKLPSLMSHALTTILLAPFIAFFMLQDGRLLARKILSLVPNSYFEVALSLNHQINLQMGAFIRARLLESAIVGLVVWIGLAIISFPYAPFLAGFAALTNLIPYVGPLIGAIPAVILALINSHTGIDLALLAFIYFIAQLIDAGIILPVVLSRVIDLHPVVVVLVIIVGAQVMGVLGMIIAIPVASAIKLTMTTIYQQLTDFRAS